MLIKILRLLGFLVWAHCAYGAQLLNSFGQMDYQNLAMAPDGESILLWDDLELEMYDLEFKPLFKIPFQNYFVPALKPKFTIDGTQIAILAPNFQQIVFFDAHNGQHLKTFDLPGNFDDFKFLGQNRILLRRMTQLYNNIAGEVYCIDMVSGSTIWTRPGTGIITAPDGLAYAIRETSTSVTYGWGVYIAYKDRYKIYSFPENVLKATTPYTQAVGTVDTSQEELLAFSPDHQQFMFGGSGIMLFDFNDGALIRTYDPSSARKFIWSPNESVIYGINSTNNLIMCDVNSANVNSVLDRVISYSLIPNGVKFGALRFTSNPAIYNQSSMQLVSTLRVKPRLTGNAAISPDGRYLISGRTDTIGEYINNRYTYRQVSTTYLFDIFSGDLLQTFSGNFEPWWAFSAANPCDPILLTSGSLLRRCYVDGTSETLTTPSGSLSANGQRLVRATTSIPDQYDIYDVQAGIKINSVTAPPSVTSMVQTTDTLFGMVGWRAEIIPKLTHDGKRLVLKRNLSRQTSWGTRSYWIYSANLIAGVAILDLNTNSLDGQYEAPLQTSSFVAPPYPDEYGFKPTIYTSPDATRVFIDKWLLDEQQQIEYSLDRTPLAASDDVELVIKRIGTTRHELYDIKNKMTLESYYFSASGGQIFKSFNKLCLAKGGKLFLFEMPRNEQNQHGGVEILRWLSPVANRFQPGDQINFEWNLNLATGGTAARLELVKLPDGITYPMSIDWAPFGASRSKFKIPDQLPPGRYLIRVRSNWDEAIYVDSDSFQVGKSETSAQNWSVYQ